ncbi:proteoglycan 4-like [Sebastes umbrosus]|uniref:proteoglycan 4-like n=2 Tax=Sebastes TaxID=34820 RepID=UPI00189DFCCC|nr:proteoglycan 4-like [Sebastes umbrosus]
MRLTALCVCGTLLVLLSLSRTTADPDEEDLLGDHGFGPCVATLRPEGPCRPGQDENTCPYLFSLPPLTLQLPKQLRELEKIVEDLQKLKDNVDQLRKMCADCTVSQTERECGRQREREHEKLNEGTDRHTEERNWLNERTPERTEAFSRECRTDRVKAEKTMAGDGDTDSEKRTILEEKEGKKWEAERESNKGVVKENERDKNLKEVAEKDGKTKTEVAKAKDKLGQAKVPTSGGNERTVVRKKVVEKNNRETETDRNTDKDGKGNSKGDPEDRLENEKERKSTSNVKNKEKTAESDRHVWRDETKETDRKTETEEDGDDDEIKMSEGRDEHTDKDGEQHGKEREKEMEIKEERNNEKSKQIESIGRAEKEKTIKEGEEGDRETGTEIKTEGEKRVQSVQRDGDGESASSESTEGTDFVSISPTLQSIISSAPRLHSMDPDGARTFTSSLPSPPSPPLSSSTSHFITEVNQAKTVVADGLQTQSTGRGAAGFSEHPSPDAEEGFRTTSRPTTAAATINTLGGLRQQITSPTSRFTSTTSATPGAGFQGQVSSTTAATTPRQTLYTTTFTGVSDRSRWTARKNITSNTKTGVKPLPGRGPKPGEKHKPANKPEADQKLKNPKNDRKPDRAPSPDKKTKHDQKQRPSHQKPTTDQRSKPSKDPKRVQIPKPDQTPRPDHLPTDRNNQIPKRDREHPTDQSPLLIQKPKSHQKPTLPVQRPTSHQRPQTVNATGSDPRTDREPESVEIPITTQNSKPKKKPVHPLRTDESDQTQKPDQRSTINRYLTPVQEPERRATTSLTPTPDQKPLTELMENFDENPSPKPKSVKDSTPGQTLTPDSALIITPPEPDSALITPPEPDSDLIKPSEPDSDLIKPSEPDSALIITPPEPDSALIITPPEPDSALIITPPEPDSALIIKPSEPDSALIITPPEPDSALIKPSEPDSALITPPEPDSDLIKPSEPDSALIKPDKPDSALIKPSEPDSALIVTPPEPDSDLIKSSEPDSDLITPPEPDSALITPTDQKPKPSQKAPKINQKPKPSPKHPEVVTGPKTKPKLKPKPDQTPLTRPGLRTPRPDQTLKAESNKTSKPRLPARRRPPTRPTVGPGATPVQRPKPAGRLKPSPKTKTNSEPLQISGTPSDDIQNSQTDMPPAPGPVTQITEVSYSTEEFRPSTMKTITLDPKTSNSLETGPFPRPHTVSEGFTVSPTSRITSDLRPQTAGRPPSIPTTTRPNKIIRGILPGVILPGVISSTGPGSTKTNQASTTDSSLQAKPLHTVKETAPRHTPDKVMVPVPTPSTQTTSTMSPDLRSTTPVTSGPEPLAAEASTPSARELRVKINQVAAFFNNSLSPSGRALDRHPKGHLEDNQGGSRPHRPGSKLPTRRPSKDVILNTLIILCDFFPSPSSAVSVARDCSDHLLRGDTKSRVYLVTPDLRSRSFPVFCDMELDGGGWTLLQRRQDGSVSFNRTWAEYRSGFGELDGGEFWLGNNMIHLLTRDRDMVLRVELEDFDGVMEYAEYEQFRVASERMRYRLTVGGYSGTAGDALRFSKSYDHNNRAFTTPDRDHDRYPSGNCGAYYSSGWWFDACMAANLNGRYYVGRYKGVRDGIFWGTWQNISTEYYPTNDRQSFKTVRMMIRPKSFGPQD